MVRRILVKKTELKLDPRYFYWINARGDVARKPRVGRLKLKNKTEIVLISDVKKIPGYLYFINKKGEIFRIKKSRTRRGRIVRMPRKKDGRKRKQ